MNTETITTVYVSCWRSSANESRLPFPIATDISLPRSGTSGTFGVCPILLLRCSVQTRSFIPGLNRNVLPDAEERYSVSRKIKAPRGKPHNGEFCEIYLINVTKTLCYAQILFSQFIFFSLKYKKLYFYVCIYIYRVNGFNKLYLWILYRQFDIVLFETTNFWTYRCFY